MMNLRYILFFFALTSSLKATYENEAPFPGGNLDEQHLMESQPVNQVTFFCQQFNISASNCSCEMNPDVCMALNFVEAVHSNATTSMLFYRWHGITVIYATIAAISSIVGMIGNAAVIVLAHRQRYQLSPCKLHIAELAVINFVFSAMQIINVVPLYWTDSWIYGPIMCTVLKTVLEMGSLLSSGFFQLIAVERYYLIVYAMSGTKVKRFGERFKHVMLAVNLFVVTATVVPYAYGLSIEPSTQRCVNFNGKLGSIGVAYNLFGITVYSFAPIIVASILTIKLIIHFAVEASRDMLVSCEDMNKKLVKNMLIILSIFIVCTLPSRFVTVMIDVATFKSHSVLLGFQFLSYILYSLQGTLNPILYSMMAKEWRRNLTAMLQKIFGANASMLSVKISLRSSSIPAE